jgi:hypothetical protein
MKLTLDISKRIVNSISGPKEQFIFAVIDLDRSGGYPANFVCLLPKDLGGKSKSCSKFFGIFGEESSRIAVGLLRKALESESDVKVKGEIEKRLKLLEPKQVTAKCTMCGCVFEPRKYGRYVERMCQKCKSKCRHDSG